MSRLLAVPGERPDLSRLSILVMGVVTAIVTGLVVGALGLIGVAGVLGGVLILLGLKFPALPFGVALVTFAVVSSEEVDNVLLNGAEVLYANLAGPVTAVDLLLAAAGIGAAVAFARMERAERAHVWTPLTAPLLAFAGAGLFMSLVVHREGTAGLTVLWPTLQLVAVCLLASALFAAGALSRRTVLWGTVAVAQVVGALGAYNALSGRGVELDDRSIAFFSSASPFVLVAAVAVLVTRMLWSSAGRRLYLAALAIIPFVGLLLAVRRGMWVDLALAIALVVAVSATTRRRVLVPALAVLLALSVGFVALTQAAPVYQERVGALATVFSETSEEENIGARQIETRAAWRNIAQAPILGIGAAKPYVSGVQFQSQNAQYLHNNVLWVWLKLGLLGLLALAWLVYRTIRTGLRASRPLGTSHRLTESQAVLATTGVLAGFFAAMLTASFLTASSRFPALVGTALALIGTTARRGRTSV